MHHLDSPTIIVCDSSSVIAFLLFISGVCSPGCVPLQPRGGGGGRGRALAFWYVRRVGSGGEIVLTGHVVCRV